MPDLIGLAKLHAAVANRWANAGLNAVFTQYWTAAQISEFVVLNDGEGAPKQPWPYCVYRLTESTPSIRMAGEGHQNWEVRDCFLEFHIFALRTSSLSAKETAAYLASLIQARFGGHPTESAAPVDVLGGDVLIIQFAGEVGMRAEKQGSDEEWKWVVRYKIRQDVPAASY